MYPIEKPPNPVATHQADCGEDESDAEILSQRHGNGVEPEDEELREQRDQVTNRSAHADLEQTLQSGLH